jgi:hypothetical protein
MFGPRNIRSIVFFAVSAAGLIACGRFGDSYREPFNTIRIGHTRTEAILIMGEPTAQTLVELPFGARAEILIWHAKPVGATYVLTIGLEHVVSKLTFN